MTGKRKWHYQLVHHGLWDMDIPCPPILVDITVNGRTVKGLAQPTKQAFLYVFNRETGQPIWPIEERPVAKGDVPGEWYSPTQPIPLDATGKPFNYDTQGFTEDDLIDFTPDLRAEAKQIVSKYKLGPVFTPPVVSKIDGPLATLVIGSGGGGTNWPGGSYDPDTHIVYVSTNKSLSQLGLVPPRDPSKNDLAYVQGNAAQGARTRAGAGGAPAAPRAEGGGAGEGGGGGGGLNVQGLPIMKPPYGSIVAIDLNKGQIIWRTAHGETPANITNHPLLKGLTIPRTGRPGTVGQLVTKTLLVVGEAGFGPTPSGQRGAMLRAYDKASGKEVGAVYMPAPQGGAPMTYMWRDRQYIVVAIGGAGYSGELLAFRLGAQ
jgi:quinoprotein glucose dehydrogenase